MTPDHITPEGTYCGVTVYQDHTTGRRFTVLAGSTDEQITKACHEHRLQYSEEPDRPRDAAPMMCLIAILAVLGMAIVIGVSISHVLHAKRTPIHAK